MFKRKGIFQYVLLLFTLSACGYMAVHNNPDAVLWSSLSALMTVLYLTKVDELEVERSNNKILKARLFKLITDRQKMSQ